MSVKDLNKRIIVNDCMNGEIVATMDYDDTYDLVCEVPCSVRTAKLIDLVLKSLENEHGCYIKVGYKNT